MAFAGFMTAMMCFFLVMWLISQNQYTRAAIAAYFRDLVTAEAGKRDRIRTHERPPC